MGSTRTAHSGRQYNGTVDAKYSNCLIQVVARMEEYWLTVNYLMVLIILVPSEEPLELSRIAVGCDPWFTPELGCLPGQTPWDSKIIHWMCRQTRKVSNSPKGGRALWHIISLRSPPTSPPIPPPKTCISFHENLDILESFTESLSQL